MSAIGLAQAIGSAALVVSLMISVGLELEPAALVELSRRRLALLLTVLVNLALIPALCWGLCAGLSLSREVTIGVMLCAAAPGGPTSALYTNIARADLALAASMTILLPALGVVATPLLLSTTVELPAGARVPVLPMVVTLVVLQVVPLAAAMLLRRRNLALAARLAPPARTLANAILGLLVIGLGITQGHLLLGISGPTWLVLIGSTIAAFALGYLGVGLGVGLGPRGSRSSGRAGAMVAACRNVSVAIMLASTFFPDPVVNATVLTFGLVTFSLPLALAHAWKLHRARELPEEPGAA